MPHFGEKAAEQEKKDMDWRGAHWWKNPYAIMVRHQDFKSLNKVHPIKPAIRIVKLLRAIFSRQIRSQQAHQCPLRSLRRRFSQIKL
jgi:hypothetical protein